MANDILRPQVSVIPATKPFVEGGGQIKKLKALRVAAYCRVSCGDESQQTSYTTQKRFYTEMINRRLGWTLAGIYADEALSGTSREKRKQFNAMMEDAVAGKMDYIVTKSISRFARNTIDTLECVRRLRQLSPPIGIYFEKENIDTLDAAGELILTILSALAQDESRSISDNIRWAIQKKFQRGEAIIDLNRFLGYDKGENGEWVINEEQADIVRYIFGRYVCGTGSSAIARELNEKGIRTLKGSIWRADTILRILKNEKYVGDLECQKTITKDFLTHKSSVNTGEAPKYYVREHHEGIIDRFTWDRVQLILKGRAIKAEDNEKPAKKKRGSRKSPFYNLTVITKEGLCSAPVRMCYNNRVKGYTDSRCAAACGSDPSEYTEHYYYSYPVWRCTKGIGGSAVKNNAQINEKSLSVSIYECALEQGFMEMLYRLKLDYEENGDESYLAEKFKEVCEKIDRQSGMRIRCGHRAKIVELQLTELENRLRAADDSQAADIKESLDELKKERDILDTEQGTLRALKKNYEFFIKCLLQLPMTNSAGMKLSINGLNAKEGCARENADEKAGKICMKQKQLAEAPDYLRFEKGIYLAFIKSGTVEGDIAAYTTCFGVTLISTGNSRSLSSFLGFRRANEDGTMDFLDECRKVAGSSICYSRRRKKGKGNSNDNHEGNLAD